ncbi:MAG: hypothetical protein WC231_04940 [Dehalococcoidales bacterium]|nr:hypothetical protein [Dehalococcoidales bacterium]MDD5605428.1 hypothetical protein [Dehalococcoidales bacterium]
MEEKDLINQLESIQFDEIELHGHKTLLRTALLKRYAAEVGDSTSNKNILQRIKEGITLKKLLRQPAFAGIMVVLLIITSMVAFSYFLGQHEKALAAEIARNSIEVAEALEGEEISGIKIIAITDNLATVKVEGVEGGSIIVKVNLLERVMRQIIIGELTSEEVEKITNILNGESDILEIINQGAVISGLHVYKVVMPENNAEKEPLEKRVQVTIILETRKYDADIEIISGEVLWFGEVGSPGWFERHIW